MAPLIPYVHPPELPLPFLSHVPIVNGLFDAGHPPSIKPFGTLVVLGVYIGSIVATRHAKQRGISEKKISDFIFWVVGIGFIGGHVLDAIFYHPAEIARNPLYIFMLWAGLSSYGGFIGAICGALLYKYKRGGSILGLCEVINSAFPLAWVFGRAGCASVHDHPGHLSDAWYAVQFPGTIGRYDLGLYEMLLTIPLAVSFLILWKRKVDRPPGFYTGLMCIAYAPVRFFLDFLRENEADYSNGGDPRYGGLTPAQWACFGLLALGIYFLSIARKGGTSMVTEADDADGSDDDQSEPEEESPAKRKGRRRKRKRVVEEPKPAATTASETEPEAEAPISASSKS